MLRNCILILFLIALAIPAAAMPVRTGDAPAMAESCHDTAPMLHEDREEHQNTPAKHSCIGCIPIASAGADYSLPVLPAMSPQPRALPKLSGTSPAPAIPPPRS